MRSYWMSPWWVGTALLCVVGAALPAWSLVQGAGLRGSLNDAGFLAGIWGASPFVLPLVTAAIARRPWVRVMVLALVGVAVLFGVVNYQLVLPRQDSARATASYFLLPIWQWPMAVLGAALALFVPAPGPEESN